MSLTRAEGGRRRTQRHKRLRRGMYLLPSVFTLGNIFCGYVSIVRSTAGEFEAAALLILVAALLDALDGRVARLTGTSSEFGLQFDSLADVVSFGVAPAMLAFSWSLSSFGRLGWAVSFLFVACGAMRLARFNLASTPHDRRWFIGMPIPAAACVLATTIFAHPAPPSRDQDPVMGAMILTLVALAALLMVSRIRYRSFKDLDLGTRRSFKILLIPAVALALIATSPATFLMLASYGYLLSGVLPRLASGRAEAAERHEPLAAAHRPGGGDAS